LSCTTSLGLLLYVTAALAQPVCPPNPSGGPNQMTLTLSDHGTDLDLGWTGIYQNFPFPGNTTLTICLTGCDAHVNPSCAGDGPTGEGSVNGPTLGPPIPLMASGVPVCLVNRYSGPVTGSVNIETGAIGSGSALGVFLDSNVYLTVPNGVCPR